MSSKRKPTLYVHIGTNKTGTTALQVALAQHRDVLAKNGLIYPRAGVRADAHHELGWQCGFFQGPAPAIQDKPEAIVAKWREELEADPSAIGLVSSEFFSLNGDMDRIQQLLEPFKVKIVVYLRRHDSWLQSVYVQAVKTVLNPRWGRGYTAYLNATQRPNTKIGNYRWLVERWAAAFGKKNIIVRPFERSQIGDNILTDLLRSIGADAAIAALPKDLPRENESLSFEAVTFLDVVNHTTIPDDIKRHLGRQMIAHDNGVVRGANYASPGFRHGQILTHLDDYEFIARKYLLREDGTFFNDPVPSPEEDWTAPANPTFMWATERICEFLGRSDDALLLTLRHFGQSRAAKT
jgi:hypothetical protein